MDLVARRRKLSAPELRAPPRGGAFCFHIFVTSRFHKNEERCHLHYSRPVPGVIPTARHVRRPVGLSRNQTVFIHGRINNGRTDTGRALSATSGNSHRPSNSVRASCYSTK